MVDDGRRKMEAGSGKKGEMKLPVGAIPCACPVIVLTWKLDFLQ